MKKPKSVKPTNEQSRLELLESLQVLDTPPELQFDDLVRLALQISGMRIAAISLIDQNRQWFKAKSDTLPHQETEREIAFCNSTILNAKGEAFIVEDALVNPDFASNPLVTGPMGIRFYVGLPLVLFERYAVGSLCVIDQKPNEISPASLDSLAKVANLAIKRLEAKSPELRSHALATLMKRRSGT